MQEEHRDGLVSKPEDYDEQRMYLSLQDSMVKQVKVFQKNSAAYDEAQRGWSRMSRNQKRRIRRRLVKRK